MFSKYRGLLLLLLLLLVIHRTHSDHDQSTNQPLPGGNPNELVARRRELTAGELEALLADPGEEISATTKQRINAVRQGLALLPTTTTTTTTLTDKIMYSLPTN